MTQGSEDLINKRKLSFNRIHKRKIMMRLAGNPMRVWKILNQTELYVHAFEWQFVGIIKSCGVLLSNSY